MGIRKIVLFLPDPFNLQKRPLVVAEACGKVLLQPGLHRLADFIAAGLLQLAHILRHLFVVAARHGEEQPLQIAGDEDIHRGRACGIEWPVAVIHPCGEEISEDIVAV